MHIWQLLPKTELLINKERLYFCFHMLLRYLEIYGSLLLAKVGQGLHLDWEIVGSRSRLKRVVTL